MGRRDRAAGGAPCRTSSNFFATEPQIALAERLLDICGAPEGSRVFLANSGTEANEAAFKMSRRTGRTRILALTESFHGRSTGALALTHKEAYREPFAPLAAGVEFIAAERRRGPHVTRWATTSPRSSSSPSRARRASSRSPTSTWSPRASCATPTARS